MRSIYKLTFPDGKIYIGQVSGSPCRRWRSGEGYKGQTELFSAIQSAGWENIKREIIAETDSPETGKELEDFYIQKYNATDPKYGYNKTHGSVIGKWNCQSKERVSQRQLGDHNTFFGKHCSEDHKAKIRSSRKEMGYKPVNMQKVLCIETGVIYESTAEATRQTGIHNFALRRVCYGQRKTAGGYHWQYV